MVLSLLAADKVLHLDIPLMVAIDDSLSKKDPETRHLEAVDFHYNYSEGNRKKPKYANGFVYVEMHLQLGTHRLYF